MFVAAVIY